MAYRCLPGNLRQPLIAMAARSRPKPKRQKPSLDGALALERVVARGGKNRQQINHLKRQLANGRFARAFALKFGRWPEGF
jgi:hypothetical protein